VRDGLRKRVHGVRQHTAHGLRLQPIMVRNPGARCSAKRIGAWTPKALARLLSETA
jgi:hypothetical protein